LNAPGETVTCLFKNTLPGAKKPENPPVIVNVAPIGKDPVKGEAWPKLAEINIGVTPVPLFEVVETKEGKA